MHCGKTFRALGIAAIAAVFIAALAGGAALGADDDEIVVASAATTNPNVRNFNVNFDQWVFPGASNPDAGKKRMEAQVNLQLAEIDRTCLLSKTQTERLELASRGDMARFLDEVERLRAKFNAVKQDQNAMNQMWQEIHPLQMKYARGLTSPDSLFAKIMTKALTPEQSRQYDVVMSERRRFRYQATIGAALHILDRTVALKHEQREALTKILLEFPAPHRFGEYDYYLVMYRLSGMPVPKLQPLFDNRQWQALRQQFDQHRGMKDQLVQEGYLVREDLNDADKEAK